MALSGSITSSTFGPGGHYKLELDWSATQSITGNTSTVTCQMWMWSDSGWSMYTSQSHSGNISIDPSGSDPLVNHGISSSISTGGGSWIKLGSSISQTLTHNSDGTMSFWLDGDFDFSGISISGSALGDVGFTSTMFTLDTIPRATTLSSPNPPNWTAGNSVTFNLTRHSSSFSETVLLEVQYKSDSSWHTVATNTGATTSSTFGNTTAQNTTIFTALNGTSSTASRLTVTTYSASGSTGSVIGSAQVYNGTVSAPAATKATAPSFNIGSTNVAITLNPANTAFTHTLQWTLASYSTTISSGITGTSYTWNTTNTDTYTSGGLSYANNMYKAIPSANSSSGTLKCTTYYNGVQVQQPISVTTVTATVTGSNPTLASGFTYADTSTSPNISVITGNNQYIVQNQSILTVTLPNSGESQGVNYATIASYNCSIPGGTNSVTIKVPSTAPTLSLSANAGSTLAVATYYVCYSWVYTATGETLVSPESSLAVTSGQNLVVTMPALPSGVTSANIYMSTSSNTETKQGSISSGTTYTRSTAISAGSALPSMTFNIGLVNAGTNQNISLQSTDTRGNASIATLPVNMVAWQIPNVNTTSTRANGFDVPVTRTAHNSTYSPVSTTVSGTTTNKNSIISVQYQYKKTTDSTWSTLTSFGTITDDGNGNYSAPDVVLSTQLDNNYAWNTQVVVTDKFGSHTVPNTVAAGIPIMFVDATLKSVGIGKFPSGTGTLELAGPLILPNNQYASVTGGAAIQLNNSDISGVNQIFTNDTMTSDTEAWQWAKDLPNGQYYFDPVTGAPNYSYFDAFRVYNSQTLLNSVIIGTDYQMSTLWNGAYYLTDTQTVTPTKKLSQCTNGWILGWSDYSSPNANNFDWNYTVVPKWHVINTVSGMGGSGVGVWAWVAVNFNAYTQKYFYVSDDHITGHANNSNTTNQPNSTSAVLRCVMAF